MVAALKRQPHRNPSRTSLGLFHEALKAAELELVERLISEGANINEPTAFGTTPLMIAAAEGHLGLVELLLAHGARINDVRKDGFSPLTFAVFFGHLEIANELIRRGADIHVQSRSGTSLKRWAEARALFEMLDLLESVESESIDDTTLISAEECIAVPFVPSLSAPIPEVKQAPIFQPEAISDFELAPLFQPELIPEVQAEPLETLPIFKPAPIVQPVAEFQPVQLVQQHASSTAEPAPFYPPQRIEEVRQAPIIEPKPMLELQPTPQLDVSSMAAWKTLDVDPGEGIRRLTPLRESEIQAEPVMPIPATAPFSPFSALIERMTSRRRYSAAIVLAIFALFGGLTFLALKTGMWNKMPSIRTAADRITSRSVSQPVPVQSQPQPVSAEESSSSLTQESSSATNPDYSTGDPALTITAETLSSGLTQDTGLNASSPRAISQHTAASKAWRKYKRSEKVPTGDVVNLSSEPEAAPVTIVSKPVPAPAPPVAPDNGRVLSSPTPDNARKRRVIQWP